MLGTAKVFKTSGVAALLLLAGLAVKSLAVAAFALAGAIVSVITAHLLGVESGLITGGLMGFSPVLTAIALGAVFYEPSPRVAVYALVGTVCTVIVQDAMNVALTPSSSTKRPGASNLARSAIRCVAPCHRARSVVQGIPDCRATWPAAGIS